MDAYKILFSRGSSAIRYSFDESDHPRDKDGKFSSKGHARKVDTMSQSFRIWFKDSAITDKNGEPLIVYHGTKNVQPLDIDNDIVDGEVAFFTLFGTFDKSRQKTEPGFFFTTDKSLAEKYGTPIPYYIRASNPVRHENPLTEQPPGHDAIFRMRGKDGHISDAWEIAVFDPKDIMPVFQKD